MESLEKYRRHFDKSYPDYADARYGEILELVSVYDDPVIVTKLASKAFLEFEALVKPLVAIKNYKSQVPFPENLSGVIRCIAEIKTASIDAKDILKNHRWHLKNLLSIQGFQLPTVSAVLHFCHPDSFPIVDVNVKSACELLSKKYPDDFSGYKVPSLPSPNTSAKNKEEKYLEFIKFIGRVRSLDSTHGKSISLRDADKALMVLGVEQLRKQAEAF